MIPGLTIASRAEIFGTSEHEQRELERREPWVAHWTARFDAGAAHMRCWIEAGRPMPDRSVLCAFGDRSVVAAAREVLVRLPDVVAHFLVGNVIVIATGVDTMGWLDELPMPPCERPLVVALSVVDPGVIAHECAHAWHRERSPLMKGLDAAQCMRLRSAVRMSIAERDDVDETIERHLQRERAADVLATAWGFPIDTTSSWRGNRRSNHLRADLERERSALAAIPEEEP